MKTKAKVFVLVVATVLTFFGGKQASAEPTTTATPCNSLDLAYRMVRSCSDGKTITDECCAVTYSALGRASGCFCDIKKEPFFRLSGLAAPRAMENVLAGCFAAPVMYSALSTVCAPYPHPPAGAPAVPAPVSPPADSFRSSPPPESPPADALGSSPPPHAPSPSDALGSSAPSPVGITVRPPIPPTPESCSGYKVAIVIPWCITGVLSILLIAIGGVIFCRKGTKYADFGHIQMMPIPFGQIHPDFASPSGDIPYTGDDDDEIAFNAGCPPSCESEHGEHICKVSKMGNEAEDVAQAESTKLPDMINAADDTGLGKRPRIPSTRYDAAIYVK